MNTTTKLLLFTLFLLYGQVFAQVTQIIDLSTGVNNTTGATLPNGNFDDTWVATYYNSPITSAYYQTTVGYPWTYPGQSGTAKWIKFPWPPNWSYDTPGTWETYCKMSFYLPTCNVQSAVLEFDEIGGDDSLDQIIVNSTPHQVYFTMGPSVIIPNNTISTNVSIPLASGEIVPGWNTIYMRVQEIGSPPSALLIKGRLKLQTSGYLDYNFYDKNGVAKTEFCMEEDVYLKETGSNLNAINGLEISEMNGNTPVWTLPFGTLPGGIVVGNNIGTINNGYAFEVNLTKLFENNVPTPIVFQPGKTYRVKLKSSGSCNLELVKDFTYKCCTSSTDASFWAKISNGQLSVNAPIIIGTHEWKVYSITNGINGQYTHLGTYTTPTISLNLANPNLCYYVTHSIKTPCGDACASQIICGAECGDKECNLTPPTGLTVSRVGNQDFLSWNPVPGAISYTVEITPNDPRCCGSAGGGLDGSISAPLVFSNIFGTSHTVDNHTFEAGPGDVDLTCYSWRVIAKCPDGGTVSSSSTCSNGSAPGGSGTSIDKSNPGSVGELSPEESSRLTIYPNPTNGMISFEVKTEKEDVYTVTITDLAGKKIESFEQMKTNKKQLRITWDTSSLVAGEYLVTLVNSANEIMVKKFIKE